MSMNTYEVPMAEDEAEIQIKIANPKTKDLHASRKLIKYE